QGIRRRDEEMHADDLAVHNAVEVPALATDGHTARPAGSAMLRRQEDDAATEVPGLTDLEAVVVGELPEPVAEPLPDALLSLVRPRGDAPARFDDEHDVIGVDLHCSREVALVGGGELRENHVDVGF